MFNKRYNYLGLEIELTRKCNKACLHCGRGDAQDVTITREIIDKIMDDVDDCMALYISGGEPLLKPEMLFYLIDQVSKHWNTYYLEITTNGSVLDSRIVDALERFCNTPTRSKEVQCEAHLVISKDQYHTPGDYKKALEFYEPLFIDANNRLGCSQDDGRLIIRTWSPIDPEETAKKDSKPILIYAGRGVDLAKNDYSYQVGKNLKVPGSNMHRLKIINDAVYCEIKITARGDVILAAEDDSFDSDDARSSGNILNQKLTDIIDQHQENCLITCAEVNIVNSERVRLVGGKNAFRFEEELSQHFLYLIFEMILKIRETAKSLYPLLSASDIILGLPMPQSEREVCDYARRIFMSIPANAVLKLDEYDLKRFEARKKECQKLSRIFVYG